MTRQWLNKRMCASIASMTLISGVLLARGLQAEELESKAAVVKPAAEELKWLKIPWVLDLSAAREMAKSEGRPIFLWVTGDDPLERC